MNFSNLTQKNLDYVKTLFPNDETIQSVTLDALVEYSKGKDSTGRDAKPADRVTLREEGLTRPSPCEIAVAGVAVDCIFVVAGAVGLHGKVSPDAMETIARAVAPEMTEIEKLVIRLANPKYPTLTRAKAVFDIAKLVYTGASFEMIYKAIVNSLTPWDAALYGALAVAELVAAFATDGVALAAVIAAELLQIGFVVSDSVKVVQECGLADVPPP